MIGQVIWLVVSWEVWGVVLIALVSVGQAGLAGAASLLVPALRLQRRFAPGRGYYLVGKAGAVAAIDHPSRRITRQESPTLFGVWFAAELVVIALVLFGVFSTDVVRESEEFQRLIRCTLGPGKAEIFF